MYLVGHIHTSSPSICLLYPEEGDHKVYNNNILLYSDKDGGMRWTKNVLTFTALVFQPLKLIMEKAQLAV